jgi:hypothetical protein
MGQITVMMGGAGDQGGTPLTPLTAEKPSSEASEAKPSLQPSIDDLRGPVKAAVRRGITCGAWVGPTRSDEMGAIRSLGS